MTSNLRTQLAVFRSLENEANTIATLKHLEYFLFVAENGTVTLADIENEFHVSNAGAARAVAAMTESSRKQYGLPGLLEIFCELGVFRDSPENYAVRLTDKGHEIYKTLNALSSS